MSMAIAVEINRVLVYYVAIMAKFLLLKCKLKRISIFLLNSCSLTDCFTEVKEVERNYFYLDFEFVLHVIRSTHMKGFQYFYVTFE